jgi:hypothetical protein
MEETDRGRFGRGILASLGRRFLGRSFFVILGVLCLCAALPKVFRGEFVYYANDFAEPGLVSVVPLLAAGVFFIYLGVRKRKVADDSTNLEESTRTKERR